MYRTCPLDSVMHPCLCGSNTKIFMISCWEKTFRKIWLWGKSAVLIIVCSHHSHISKQPLLHLLCPFALFLLEINKADPDPFPCTEYLAHMLCGQCGSLPKKHHICQIQLSNFQCTVQQIIDCSMDNCGDQKSPGAAVVWSWDRVSFAWSYFLVWLFLGSGGVWTRIAFACWLMLCLWERFARCEPNSCAFTFMQSLPLFVFSPSAVTL